MLNIWLVRYITRVVASGVKKVNNDKLEIVKAGQHTQGASLPTLVLAHTSTHRSVLRKGARALLPEEEAELTHMQEARELQTSLTAEKDHMLVRCLELLELQVIFKPQPAEHLDYQG